MISFLGAGVKPCLKFLGVYYGRLFRFSCASRGFLDTFPLKKYLFLLLFVSGFSNAIDFSEWSNLGGSRTEAWCLLNASGSPDHYAHWTLLTVQPDPYPDLGQCYVWVGLPDEDPCSEGESYNQDTYSCSQSCQPGSISADCAVDCPSQEYTYYDQGIKKYGSLGGGQVGYGQSCPSPSFPGGSEDGCVGSPGVCNTTDAIHEKEKVDKFIKDTQKTQNPDGSETETTTQQKQSSDSHDSGSGSGGSSSSGTDGKTSGGLAVDPSQAGLYPDDPSGLSTDQVNIDGEKYQLCNDGSIANSTAGCDYVRHSCSEGSYDTEDGCYTPPQSDPPPDSDPTDKTETTTSSDGNTTTTTTTQSSGSGTGANSGDGVGSDPSDEDTPETVSGGGACDSRPSCEGDPIECAILQQDHDTFCAESDAIENLESDAESFFSGKGLTDLDTISEGSLLDNLSPVDETDLESDYSSFLDAPAASGSCPSPIPVNLGKFGNVEFSLQFFCDLASAIRVLVLLLATITGGTIVLRSLVGD